MMAREANSSRGNSSFKIEATTTPSTSVLLCGYNVD
jgi:hypothetical protein